MVTLLVEKLDAPRRRRLFLLLDYLQLLRLLLDDLARFGQLFSQLVGLHGKVNQSTTRNNRTAPSPPIRL